MAAGEIISARGCISEALTFKGCVMKRLSKKEMTMEMSHLMEFSLP